MRELVGYSGIARHAGLKRNPFWWAEAIWSREPVVFIRPEISKFRAGHTALVGKRKNRGEEGRGGLGHAVLRFAEPKQKGFSRWRGDETVRRAVTNNRVRLKSHIFAPRVSADIKALFQGIITLTERDFSPYGIPMGRALT